MTLSMYSASVPVFTRMLKNLLAIFDKAEAHAAANNIDLQTYVGSRLADDMIPFSGQIQIATDGAKGVSARLAGQPLPSWPDDEVTWAELRARLQKAIDYLATLSPEAFTGADTRTVTLKIGGNDVEFDGETYLLNRGLPNFYFHVTTAYDILRHKGVPIGKKDYLG
ncbi:MULTISPECIES: DUF1993 domain-containing protein [unclassified Devosia]|uniref:DUF1993 domain-containing protein n=1 Tax=unclassified Devosia TaxID=196773 RepID=UPI000713BA58|nr:MULTISPECIES: DUF1993 domain-containing protein [unclassified Devosia]KQN74131.1 hypothetical protein ASE94_03775 [Devosia sp. Leaf64]KQT44978.1 hypothetical protein ASG47_16280 [Devosia sp. Leaf420]